MHTLVTTCTAITNRSIWSSFNIVLKFKKHCQCLAQKRGLPVEINCYSAALLNLFIMVVCLFHQGGKAIAQIHRPIKSEFKAKRGKNELPRIVMNFKFCFRLSFATSKVFKMVVCMLCNLTVLNYKIYLRRLDVNYVFLTLPNFGFH